MSESKQTEANKRVVSGVITSDIRDKTVTIEVERVTRHPLYGKVLRKKTKYQVHDPENQGKKGDIIEIIQVRPISKTKTWELSRIVKKAPELALL
tara:strand:- start:19606 stop:19890 length:285 start_codon:yes stop_codon:yes gene_type:complete